MSAGVAVPSWDELFKRLPLNKRKPAEISDEVVFYRDKEAKCPDCQRVWLALLEKGIIFAEDVESVPKGHSRPALAVNGSVTSGWSDIFFKLEEDFPGVRLLPVSDDKREAAHAIITSADALLDLPAFLLSDRSAPALAMELKARMMEEAEGVEGMLGEEEGDFVLGEAFSVADVALVPVLEAAAVQSTALDETLQLRGNPKLPNIDRWFSALEERVASYRARVQADPISLASRLAELPGCEHAAALAVERLTAAEDWRAILSEDIPPSWVAFTRRYITVAKSPKVEAAAAVMARKEEWLAEIRQEVSEWSQGQPRPRSSEGGDVGGKGGDVPDVGMRLLVSAILEAPDYGSAPTFANTFLRTMLEDLSSDELKEMSEVLLHLRLHTSAPKDFGALPARAFRAHAAWVGRELLRAARDKEKA